MTQRKIWLATASALIIGTITATPILAQDAPDDEIIITATKREQTLQETPVAVTVTSADTIEKTQILDIADLQSVVPSLRVTQLQTSASTNFIIRGFGNGANNAGIEPSVGVFIDGVYRSRSAAQIGDLPKLQRVEVLRGPQSTLFGKNASSGVISIATAEPSYETQGYIEGGIGNYDLRLVRGYATGALAENVAYSLGGSMNKREGYSENVLGLGDVNERDRWNLRGQLLVEPTENVSLRFIADVSEIDENCCTVTNFLNGPTAPAIAAVGGTLADPADPFAYRTYQNSDSVNEITNKGISAQLDVSFDNFDLTSISAFRNNDTFSSGDTDFTTAHILDATGGGADIDTLTQEIRLTSTGDNNIDWMVGGYYFDEDITQETFIDIGSDFQQYIGLLAGDTTILGTLEGLYGFAPGTFFNENVRTLDTFTQENTAYSLFTTVDFHVSEQLILTGGLNYTNDQKTITGKADIPEDFSNIDLNNDITLAGAPLPTVLTAQGFPDITTACGLGPLSFFDPAALPALLAAPACFGPLTGLTGAQAFGVLQTNVADGITGLQAIQFLPQFLAFPNAVEDGESDEDEVTWTARAAYEVNDTVNVYVSAATGYKATSWNLSRDSRPFAADLAALTTEGLTLPNQTTGTRFAGPETALTYEVGLKANFDRGSLNIALFHQSIDDFQSNTFVGTGFVLSNAGETSVKGLELDGTFAPVDPLTLRFAATLLDAKFDSFPNALGPNNTVVDRSGERIDGIPEVSIATSATYNFDVGADMTGYVRGDYQFESETNVAADVFAIQPTRSISMVNASAGLKTPSGIGVQVWVRNLNNEEFIQAVFPGVVQSGTVNGYPNTPRTYGVSVRKEF